MNNEINPAQSTNLPKISLKVKEKEKDEDVIKQYFNEVAPKQEENKESFIPKIDPSKKPKWCLTKEEAENLNDKEDEKLIEFAQNLDYDKYMKDMEVREALYLIKSKIENGDQNHEFKVEGKEENKDNDNNENPDEAVEREGRPAETDPIEKLKNELTIKKVEHENEWNASNKVGDESGNKIEEKIKKSVAEEILKNNTVLILLNNLI